MSGGFAVAAESGGFKGVIVSNLNHFSRGPVNYINLLVAKDVLQGLLCSIFEGRFDKRRRILIKRKEDRKRVKDIQNYSSDFELKIV